MKPTIEHPDDHYYGGRYWKMQWPMCHRYMITSLDAGQFALVTDPLGEGSMVKHKLGGGYVFTLGELKAFLSKAEYLGSFNERAANA